MTRDLLRAAPALILSIPVLLAPPARGAEESPSNPEAPSEAIGGVINITSPAGSDA